MRHEVIVYRSPWEAFYFDNPQYILYALLLGVGVVGVYVAYSYVREFFRRRRNKGYRYHPY